jgi:hypothetical protein
MSLDVQKIMEYEKILPLSMQPLVEVMPGCDVILRDDLSLISSQEYPAPDGNYASVLRTTKENADALIEEIVAYFKARDIQPAVFLSPACTPSDLAQRLLKRGFVRQEPDESWLVFEHLQKARVPKTDPKYEIRPVESKADVRLFAEIMMVAYEMPPEMAPMLVNVLEPTIGQPNTKHYLAYVNQEPAATMTLSRYKDYVIVGSGGVLPKHRGSSLVFNLGVQVLAQARQEGVDTILGQTTLGPIFERFLRICGFKFAFKRTGYILG